MRYWKATIMFLIGFLVQTSLLNLVSIFGHTPNLLLCLVIVLSFIYENDMYGLILGAVFGCLFDICNSTVIGPTPIALVLVAILILFLREYANVENIINMWITTLVGIVIYYVINWGLCQIGGNPIGIKAALSNLPWSIVLNLIVVTIIYIVLIRGTVKHRKDRYFR